MNGERLVSRLELAGQRDAATWARRHCRSLLGSRGLVAERIDTVELCVSELVTNAVRIAEGTPNAPLTRISLTLTHSPGKVVIEVADGFPQPPIRTGLVGPRAENGRGLFIVEAVSKEWGYFRPPTGGKVVWCVVGLE
ncbi:ATP-binding protein [Streptomyces sp. ST2-7A]|uniref:ATP-binding protein n=1 Tax=Streptomyces sp. ST2-7A TaxID=2907214 RepID=UPI001F200B6F|nr:ATP-binding protein [Streptomyces sp. ST2-7A]MCE7078649.1 ATP-binding protein [Streptomyces sp. ST2-7A]